MPQLTELI